MDEINLPEPPPLENADEFSKNACLVVVASLIFVAVFVFVVSALLYRYADNIEQLYRCIESIWYWLAGM